MTGARTILSVCRRSAWLAALLLFAVAPLAVCIVLYGHRLWISQWREIPVALGWSAPRYSWQAEARTTGGTSPTELLRLQRSLAKSPENEKDRSASTQGLSFVLRGKYQPSESNPVELILWYELSPEAQRIVAQYYNTDEAYQLIESALGDSPNDPYLHADWMTTYVSNQPILNHELLQAKAKSAELNEVSFPNEVGSESLVDRHWRFLVGAGYLLATEAGPPAPRPSNAWRNVSNVPQIVATMREEVRFRHPQGKLAYAKALRRLTELGPAEYLEIPFEERTRKAWEQLGMDPRAAGYLARSDFGASSAVVAWHCSLQTEAVKALVIEAYYDHRFDEAADWIELAEKLAILLKESVRSPWLSNYLELEYGNLATLASGVKNEEGCPPEIADRMAALIARIRPRTVRPVPGFSPYIVPALCLDNFSRKCLGVSAVALLVAFVGWVNIRIRQRTEESGLKPTERPVGTLLVAASSVLFVGSAFAAIELADTRAQGGTNFFYAVTGGLVFLAALAAAWWLVVSEWVRDGNSAEQSVRRRMIWLVGGLLLGAILYLLQGTAAAREHFSNQTIVVGLGLLAACLVIVFGVWNWRRWEREREDPPLLHPVVPIVAGLLVGIWFLRDAFFSERVATAGQATESSPGIIATDAVKFALMHYEGMQTGVWNFNNNGRRCDLLTASYIARVTNLGAWLVLACSMIWALLVRRGSQERGSSAGAAASASARNVRGQRWVAGTTWSCFWLGLITLSLHGWCTLGLCYCLNRILTMG